MTPSELRIENGELREANLQAQFSVLNVAVHSLLFCVAVALYTLTLNGDVQPADSGEFQIAAITLGIPHPPGYPLFTMLGWLFAQIPIGSPYARVSFLSVVASAATLVLVSLTVVKGLTFKRLNVRTFERLIALLAGLTAAVALGTSTTFWAQATTTNIRSLTALFTALMLYASARACTTRRVSSLVLFAAAFGLGVGHHVSLIFTGVVLGAYVLYTTWRARDEDEGSLRFSRAAIYAVIALGATQLVWLYLPIRDAMGARFAPGNLTTLNGLLFHVFARGFAGDMLAFAAPEFLGDRIATLPTLLEFQFTLPVLTGMALATVVLVWRRMAVGLVWLIAFAVHLFITITYRAPQTVEYAMPNWVIACAVLGAGLGAIAFSKPQAASLKVPVGRKTAFSFQLSAVILLLAALAFVSRDATQRWPSYVYLGRDRSTRASADAVLRYAQPQSAILSQWHQVTPLWALQDIEGVQRDVRVEYVYPRGAQPYAETFAERAAQSAKDRWTYVTTFFERELAAQGLQSFPLSKTPGWRVAQAFDLPGSVFPGVSFDGRLFVVGPLGIQNQTVEAGQAVEMDVWWQTRTEHKPGDSISVRILRPDGRLAANADVRLSPDEQLRTFYFRRVVLGVPLDLPPGEYPVYVGAYQVNEDGAEAYKDAGGTEFVPAGSIRVEPASHMPAMQHLININVANLDVIGKVPRLIGVDYDTGIPGQLRVWTHWQLGEAAQEITLLSADNQPLAPAKQLSAATAFTQPQYLSLPFDIAPLRNIRVAPNNVPLPDYAEGQRYIPFANQMALIGSNTQRSGASLKADLQWLAARPLTHDYIVSVRIAGNGLYKTHDSVPALGAIPTLKWIRGSRVTDRHPFDLGDYRDALSGSVVVYDSVSQLPLPPLDERYENGVTIPIQ